MVLHQCDAAYSSEQRRSRVRGTEIKICPQKIKILQESPDYSFMSCVRTSHSQKVGCRPPWDTAWSPASLPVCDNTGQLAEHESLDWGLYNYEKKVVINSTGCKIPCTYSEYKVVGEPQGGSSAKMGTDNNRQRCESKIKYEYPVHHFTL